MVFDWFSIEVQVRRRARDEDLKINKNNMRTIENNQEEHTMGHELEQEQVISDNLAIP